MGIYGKHLSKIFILGLSIYYIFFIPLGFDATDTGFHLSKQWAMFHGAWKENFDMISGTNIIGGFWLFIPGKPLLIWARLGFVIVQVTIMYFSYKILLLYFKPLRVFAVFTVIAVTLSFWQFYMTINYDNLPLMFVMISSYYLLTGNINAGKNKNKLFSYSGFFMVMAIFCKITFLPIIILPSVLLLSDKTKLRYFFYGILSGISTLMIVMIATGAFATYINNYFDLISDLFTEKNLSEKENLTRDHSAVSLFWTYKNEFIKIINISIHMLFSISIFTFLISRVKNNKVIKYTLYAVSGWFYYYLIFEPSANYGIIAFSFTLIIFWLITSNKEELRHYSDSILIVVSIFIISFFGSDLGISTGIRAGSTVLLACMSLLLIYDSKIQFNKIRISFKYIFYVVIILFTAYHIQDKFRPYQDYEYKFMTDSFKSPQLIGIKSNKDRVEVVDSLLAYLNSVPDLQNKKVFFAKHSPMYYYLTGTIYTLDSPWDTLNDLNEIKKDFIKEKPEYFVTPKGSHRDYMWPNAQKGWEKEGGEIKAQRYYDFYDSFIKDNNYVEVYKNSFYTVYSLEDKGVQDEQSTE